MSENEPCGNLINSYGCRFLINFLSKSPPEQVLRIYFDAKSPFYSNSFLFFKIFSAKILFSDRKHTGKRTLWELKMNLSKMVILHQNKFAKRVLEAIYSKN